MFELVFQKISNKLRPNSFTYSNESIITPNGLFIIDFEDKARKYIPFPVVFILNNSSCNLEVWHNMFLKTILLAGNEKPYQMVTRLKIKNIDSTNSIAVGEITALAVKE